MVVEDAECGAGSSKGEAGLLGSGEPARLRKGLLLERFRDKPGEDWSVKMPLQLTELSAHSLSVVIQVE